MEKGTLLASSEKNNPNPQGIYREVLSNILEISTGTEKNKYINIKSLIKEYVRNVNYEAESNYRDFKESFSQAKYYEEDFNEEIEAHQEHDKFLESQEGGKLIPITESMSKEFDSWDEESTKILTKIEENEKKLAKVESDTNYQKEKKYLKNLTFNGDNDLKNLGQFTISDNHLDKILIDKNYSECSPYFFGPLSINSKQKMNKKIIFLQGEFPTYFKEFDIGIFDFLKVLEIDIERKINKMKIILEEEKKYIDKKFKNKIDKISLLGNDKNGEV